RWIGNPILSFLGRVFFRTRVHDFHCGLRAFRRDRVLALDLRSTGMEYATEMVAKSALYRLKVGEVPATLAPDRRDRPPHLRTWRDGWRHLRFMLLYSPRWLFLYPGALLMVVGALVSLWLLPGPQRAGSVSFDLHTLVYAAIAMIVGFQAVVFALFTKTFAISEGLLPKDERLERLYGYVRLETGLGPLVTQQTESRERGRGLLRPETVVPLQIQTVGETERAQHPDDAVHRRCGHGEHESATGA